MQLNIQTPRKFLNPLLSQKSVVSTDVDTFKVALNSYVAQVQQLAAIGQNEPNIVSGALMPFLQAQPLAYNCRPHNHHGNSGIDLAILSGKDVSVIIEAKVAGSHEMITAHDLNKRAFHEAVFYFMQERHKKNDKLTHVVVTDFYQWFVFDAKDFDRLFWRNSQLQKTFNAFHDPNSLFRGTTEFYKAVADELPKMRCDLITEESIDCAYFNVLTTDSIKDKELTAIYKLLSPDSLLKGFNPNDANSLNREFYNELLYILGLNEVKDGGKRLIKASGIAGSLYDGIADKLDQKGAPKEFEDVIKLIIIWINRILFLKLLESQIVTWTGEKTSRFLSADKISGYDALENLFFDTLARRIPDRKNKGFDYIPYLNSSLFEMQEEEKAGISISALPDGAQIAYYGKTVVKDAATKRKSGQTSTLAYLFEFLDAYDFANDNDKEVREETKSLISASVLGLIFEKINGYKDGSFYTPSFVTMYMARQTIEKAVLQKFNEKYSWTCSTLLELHNKIDDIPTANKIIDSLKICDPAVGSGHFLVSALNEILRIKDVLGVLLDVDGKRIKDWHLTIENDELIVTSDEGELFEYKRGNSAKTRIQKTLFQEKQKIIENCLFGVDINPNSVNICRLRLWIELLKNAYYQPNGELETLPNIDINIKCGNSLISRFALDTDLKDALKKSKISVDEYRAAVSNYRNTSDKAEKKQIEALIESIKTNFRKEMEYLHLDPKQKRFTELPKIIKALETSQSLLGETAKEEKERKQKHAKLSAELVKLSSEVEDIKTSKIYQNAFEWRFEFPEVMNVEGKFIGFDVIIGNPPYIMEYENKSAFDGLHGNPCYQGKTDIWHLFTHQGLSIAKPNGYLSYIAKNQWMDSQAATNMRNVIYKESEILSIVDFGTNMVFDEASQQTMIFLLCKNKSNKSHEILYKKYTANLESLEIAKILQNTLSSEFMLVIKKSITKNYDEAANLNFSDDKAEFALEKIDAQKNFIFDEKIEIIQGIIGAPDNAFLLTETSSKYFNDDEKKYIKIFYTNTGKYVTTQSSEYIIYLSDKNFKNQKLSAYPNFENHFQPNKTILTQAKIKYKTPNKPYYYLHRERDESFFIKGDKLVFAARTIGKNFTFTDKDFYGSRNLFFIKTDRVNLKYIAALLNSELMYFYMHQRLKHTGDLLQIDKNQFMKIPMYVPNEKTQKPFISKVDAILKAKAKGSDTSKLEREIDDMVYRLYGLTYDEVKTIEPEYRLSREEYEAAA